MGAVNRNDQHMGYYSLLKLRSPKWWLPLMMYFLEEAIIQGFYLHTFCRKRTTTTLRDQRSYRVELMTQLLGSYTGRQRFSRPLAPHARVMSANILDHMPLQLPEDKSARIHGGKPTAKCAYCNRRDAGYYCKGCDAPLHVQCFKAYHVQHFGGQ